MVPNEKQQHDITVGISNSFGFGGHNSESWGWEATPA